MHEVRVESLEKLEWREGRMRLLANAGSQEVWEDLLSGDESLRVLGVRGRSCSTSRFEMPPELWRCSRGGSAGGTFIPLLPGDSLCRS